MNMNAYNAGIKAGLRFLRGRKYNGIGSIEALHEYISEYELDVSPKERRKVWYIAGLREVEDDWIRYAKNDRKHNILASKGMYYKYDGDNTEYNREFRALDGFVLPTRRNFDAVRFQVLFNYNYVLKTKRW